MVMWHGKSGRRADIAMIEIRGQVRITGQGLWPTTGIIGVAKGRGAQGIPVEYAAPSQLAANRHEVSPLDYS